MGASALLPKANHARTAGAVIGAAIIAAVVATIVLAVIDRVQWPAFNSSNVTGALTTLGQAVAIIVLAAAVVLHRMGLVRKTVTGLSWIGTAGFATITLAMPLGATKLYLFGISVDQQFRTEYLTRFTDSAHLSDMTYANLAPYYPAGWFWFGGRYASLAGQPGWEAFKPWAITSIAIAAVVALVLWTRMIATDRAIAVTVVSTALTIYYAGSEPYAAVLILVGVPMLVVITHALRSGSGPAILAGGLFLGVSASFYTLFTGLFALSTVLMALWLIVIAIQRSRNAASPASIRRIIGAIAIRLISIGVISGLIALVFWAPYLLARLRNRPASGGSAEHYLPTGGATLPAPMLQFNLIGILCAIGIIWVVLRFRSRTIATTLGVATLAIYLFSLLSMAATAVGTTLLAFRLEPLLAVVLGVAGVCGIGELARAAVSRFGDIRTVIVVGGVVCAIAVAQGIPSHLSSEISIAYTDTDGNGVRADKRPPGAESFYPQINSLIAEQTGVPADQTVVLTADFGFLSIYPYYGFQGLTSHYANPLAEFDKRANTIEQWAGITDPNAMISALDSAAWKPPRAFLFRYSPDGYTLRLAADVYPNDPNVKRYTVTFTPQAFADPRFTVTPVGPFVLVVRK